MNIEKKNSWWLKHGYWLLPAAIAVIVVLLMLLPAYWIDSLPVYTGRIEQSEKQRKIVTFTIQTPKGELVVTELRSGTEFNRILQMPCGKVIAEAGWINRWGEEQIRMIGRRMNRKKSRRESPPAESWVRSRSRAIHLDQTSA